MEYKIWSIQVRESYFARVLGTVSRRFLDFGLVSRNQRVSLLSGEYPDLLIYLF